MEGNWVRLYRKSLDSRVFSDEWLWRLWCWCLLKAQWQACWFEGCKLVAGQFACATRESAVELGVSPSRFWRGLQKLQEWSQIHVAIVKRAFSVVTICNWSTYQSEEEGKRNTNETQMKHARNTDETPLLLDEELKELKEGEEGARAPRRFQKPTLEEVAAYCRERGNRIDPAAFLDHYEANGWRVGRSPMRDWKAAVRTWEKREPEFAARNPQTTLFDEQTAERLRKLQCKGPTTNGHGDTLPSSG